MGRNALVISTLADTVLRQIENVQDAVSETLFEPFIRVGVTGLARSGKTVFITSLVANLLDRGRIVAFGPKDEVIRKLQAREYGSAAEKTDV